MTDQLDRLKAALADRYKIERQLGAGGMATVYLAHDVKHDRPVALKVLKPQLAAVLGTERFMREIKVTAQLTHPNILPVLDSGGSDDLLYYVMPLVEGESLRERLDKGSVSIEQAVQFATEVADALGTAHRHGIVHRDIKPENILLVEGHAVVADFGIATAMSGASDAKLTETGMAIGTPLYMSPEQAAGETVDARSDVYSVGCTLFECLAGRPPFAGPTAASIVQQHLTATPPAIETIRLGVPEGLSLALGRALAKNPADRFDNGARLVEALKRSSATVSAPSRAATPARPAWVVPTAVAAVTIIGLGSWWIASHRAGDALALSAEQLAVFPFAVRSPDPEHEYLGDGIAEMLSTALDGVGDFRVIDPGVAIARRPAADRYEATARELGAGRYVSGAVSAAGRGRVQVRATLHTVSDATPVSAQVTGDPDSLLELTTALGRELLVGYALSARARVDSLALATTDSVEALKAYLRGVRHYRASEYNEAIDALSRAVAIDSSFAIAYLSLARAASWEERHALSMRAAEAGVRASRGPNVLPRHRALLEMSLALERGDGPTMEDLAREVLREYPNEFEALYMLGEIRSHNGPFYGEPSTTAREPHWRAFQLDPARGDAAFHLTLDQAFGHRDLDLLDTVLAAQGVDPEESIIRRTLLAYTQGDSTDRAALLPAAQGDLFQPVRLWMLGEVADATVLAGRLASEATDPMLAIYFQRWWAWGTIGQGRLRSAMVLADSTSIYAPVQGAELAAYLAAVPFLDVSRDGLRAARERLASIDHRTAPRCTVARRYVCVHDDVHAHLQQYLLGVLSVKLGDHATAERHAVALEALPGNEDARALGRDLSLGIRGAIASERGQLDEALQLLELTSTARKIELVRDSPIFGLLAERYRQADLLARLGRNDEALRRFESLLFYPQYRAAVHLRRGEIFESMGEPDSAAVQYGEFNRLWGDADQEYRALVDDVGDRLARLVQEAR